MAPKRGSPVFLELLKGRADRGQGPPAPAPGGAPTLFDRPKRPTSPAVLPGTPGSAPGAAAPVEPNPGPPLRLRPAPADHAPSAAVEPKPRTAAPPEATDRASDAEPAFAGLDRRTWITVAFAAAGIAVAWAWAYSRGFEAGEKQGQRPLEQLVGKDRASGPKGVTDPLQTPGPASGGGTPAGSQGSPSPGPVPTPIPTPPPPSPVVPERATPGVDVATTLESGRNYLIVATLFRKDATEASQYLESNGVRVAMVPLGGVDPGDPRANNGQWQVMVLRGYHKSDLGRTEAEREALKSLIQRLGRKWKAENRKAPVDFSQIYWARYTGP